MRGDLGYSREPEFCIVWRDRHSDELGFRITLSFEPSGEEFVYYVPPDTREFFFPRSDWPEQFPGFDATCCFIRRKDYTVFVYAVLPNGEVRVDGFAVQVG